jgi:RNA polymerase sigma-70 factor (ECF subfamily)
MRSGGQLTDLVDAAKAGDRLAFSSLIEEASPAAYRAALGVLGSPDDARDALQDAALRAWQRLAGLRQPAAWPSWFRRIAVRTALDRARQGHRGREMQLLEFDQPESDPAPAADQHLTLLAALSRLSADDRAVLSLRFGSDLEVPDVAAALAIPLGTAKARLHRALGRLRAQLGEDDHD